MVRLDEWSEAQGLLRVDVIKLDVDGYEYPVLAGGMATIARTRPTFIIEATGLHFSDAARNPFEVLRSLGYHLWNLEGQEMWTFERVRDMLSRHDPAFSINLVARPAGA